MEGLSQKVESLQELVASAFDSRRDVIERLAAAFAVAAHTRDLLDALSVLAKEQGHAWADFQRLWTAVESAPPGAAASRLIIDMAPPVPIVRTPSTAEDEWYDWLNAHPDEAPRAECAVPPPAAGSSDKEPD